MFQVSMALYGFDVPHSKKPSDADRRRIVFDTIKPYVFSKADYKDLDDYKENIVELWLQTFTNSQNTMIKTKLVNNTKDWFRKYFPNDGASPNPTLCKQVGLAHGQSILDRYFYNE